MCRKWKLKLTCALFHACYHEDGIIMTVINVDRDPSDLDRYKSRLWSRSRRKFITGDWRNSAETSTGDSRCNAGFPVWTRPRRLLPNNLMQPEQAVKEATRPPSPVNHRWQPKTHCSITEPQRRAEPRCTVEIQVADEHRAAAQGARAAGRETAVARGSIPPRSRNALTILQMEAMFLTVI